MNLFKLLLIIHVITGTVSLLLGFYVLLTKKGDKKHKLIGRVYFYAMLTAALVALPMSYLHSNYFLFIIGAFTSFMLLSGKRYLSKKSGADVKIIDWLLTLIMLLLGICFVVFGIYNIVKANYFGIVFLLFGGIGNLFIYQDINNFRGRSKVKNFGLTTHIQRMMGSYIASVTAFLVVNNNILPGIIAWILPTAILTPLIIKWTRKYKVDAS